MRFVEHRRRFLGRVLRTCALALGVGSFLSGGWMEPLFAAPGGGGVRVASFSTVLTEIAQRVGGEVAEVAALIPVGVDPHEFEPKPSAFARAAESDVVLVSAKHLEGYLGKLKEVLGGRVRVLEVGNQLPSLWLDLGGGQRVEDPHWWNSVENMQRAVRLIRDEFSAIRPESRAVFEGNAAAFLEELSQLKDWVRKRVSELPRERRKLVTSHEALQHFAREFGFKVYSVEGLNPSDQPSSRRVAELLEVIRSQKVKAVFSQDTANPKVVRQITAETGAVLGGRLWVDGLGPGEASTYCGMVRQNVNAIVDGLK